MNTTRTSQAIPKASHRTYAAKEPYFRMWSADPTDEHFKKNQNTQAYIYGRKVWLGKKPDGSYYYYNSRGDMYPYDHKKIYRN